MRICRRGVFRHGDSGKEISAPKLPPAVISYLEWHRNNRDLAIGLETARDTADVYSLDVKTGKFERWTESETGELNTKEFSMPEVIHWKTFDGKMIFGLYYKPPAKFSGKRPVISDIHGGPEGRARPWFQAQWNYFVNELGVALIQPNVRGSTYGISKAESKFGDSSNPLNGSRRIPYTCRQFVPHSYRIQGRCLS